MCSVLPGRRSIDASIKRIGSVCPASGGASSAAGSSGLPASFVEAIHPSTKKPAARVAERGGEDESSALHGAPSCARAARAFQRRRWPSDSRPRAPPSLGSRRVNKRRISAVLPRSRESPPFGRMLACWSLGFHGGSRLEPAKSGRTVADRRSGQRETNEPCRGAVLVARHVDSRALRTPVRRPTSSRPSRRRLFDLLKQPSPANDKKVAALFDEMLDYDALAEASLGIGVGRAHGRREGRVQRRS